jgi:quinol monooxygenase YgiN
MTEAGIGTIYTLAEWTVKPGDEDAFVSAWTDFARWTAENQPGAMTGVLLRDTHEPLRFISLGPWKDRGAADAWRQTPQFQESFARFRDLCSAIKPQTLISVATSESSR